MPSFRVVAEQEDPPSGRYRAKLYRPADAPAPISVGKQSYSSPQAAVNSLLASLEPHFKEHLLSYD